MQQTSLNIGTIGQKLETARQAKGVSVSEAGRSTKILSKFIEAMECDDFGALSAPVYAKSFIRMYAKYLGIESQPLVDEYVEQHAPKVKPPLGDEVRQNLTQIDQVPAEIPTPSPAGGGKQVFGGVNQALAHISSSRIPTKTWAMGGAGVLLLLIILFAVKQCDSDDETVPAAGSAASVGERELLGEGMPDTYLDLAKPGEIKVDP